jgi:hypothetical protein
MFLFLLNSVRIARSKREAAIQQWDVFNLQTLWTNHNNSALHNSHPVKRYYAFALETNADMYLVVILSPQTVCMH